MIHNGMEAGKSNGVAAGMLCKEIPNSKVSPACSFIDWVHLPSSTKKDWQFVVIHATITRDLSRHTKCTYND
jgi:hypothetical protein